MPPADAPVKVPVVDEAVQQVDNTVTQVNGETGRALTDVTATVLGG